MGNLISFMRKVADELHNGRCFGTAHVYRSSANAIIVFHGNDKVLFKELTPEFVKRFELHLRGRGCSWNTVSTYMRTLRAIYHRAVERHMVAYSPYLFRHVYTGTKADQKRALDNGDMAQLLNEQAKSIKLSYALKRTRGLFVLMFMLRGLPFVDLVYLRKSDLNGNVISYRRRKTGKQLTVTLTSEAMGLLKTYINSNSSSLYLFPFLSSPEGTKEAYREYQLALRSFNYQLILLGKALSLSSTLSTYTARHTWATMAYYCEIHPGIISEAMGHSSITVTETYLKPFRNKKLDEANLKIIDFARHSDIS